MSQIKITCRCSDHLPFQRMVDFQGDVKTHDSRDIEHLINSILQHGFSFPIFLWHHDAIYHCLDGHGRIQALAELERRGYEIPEIPVVFIKADSEQEAKRKFVEINNLNGDFVENTFINFTQDLELNLADYNIPGLDLSAIDAKLHQAITENAEKPKRMIDIVCPECKHEFQTEEWSGE